MHADRNTAIALATILTAWFFGSLIAAKGLFSQETAAWVQAIGAIAAIAATGYFALLPNRLAERRRRADATNELDRIVDAFNALRLSVDPIRWALDAEDFDMTVEAIVRARSVPTATAAIAYLEMPPTAWPTTPLYIWGNIVRNEFEKLVANRGSWASLEEAREHLQKFDLECEAFDYEISRLR